MRRAVVVVLDGMRRDLINDETTPTLARFAARAQSFAVHRSMFPSATRVVSASFATGCTPARHELQGNSLALMENGRPRLPRCRTSRIPAAQAARDGPFAGGADHG